MRGYLERVVLTDYEIQNIPYLIRLRRWVMLLYYGGRYIQGLDSETWMRVTVYWCLLADDWLNDHGTEFVRRLTEWNSSSGQGVP